MSIDERIQILIAISKKKYDMIEEFFGITKAQNISITNQNIDLLMKEIKEKQAIMDFVDKLDLEFYSEYTKLKSDLNITSLDQVKIKDYPKLQELKDITSKIMDMLKDIDNLDKSNKVILNRDIEIIKNEFKEVKLNISNSKKVYSGYNNKYNHSQGVFIDNKK